jgi:hypothetical protein
MSFLELRLRLHRRYLDWMQNIQKSNQTHFLGLDILLYFVCLIPDIASADLLLYSSTIFDLIVFTIYQKILWVSASVQ